MQIALLLTLLAPLILPQGDPAKDMKSKDYSVRLAAVQNLAVVEHAQAEKLLVAALKDKDWEVIEAAASALGKVGGKSSAAALLKLALDGPTLRIRSVAAASLAQAHGVAGWQALEKKIGGKTALEACRAAIAFWPLMDGKAELKAVEKLWKGKEKEIKPLAAQVMVLLAGETRSEVLQTIVASQAVEATALAIDAVAKAGDSSCLPILIQILASKNSDVIKRRASTAILQLLTSSDNAGRSAQQLWAALEGADPLIGGPSLIRLIAEACKREVLAADATRDKFIAILEYSGDLKQRDLRAAICDSLSKLRGGPSESDQGASSALGFLGKSNKNDGTEQAPPADADVVKALVQILRTDAVPRVRAAALRSLVRAVPVTHPTCAEALIDVLQKDQASRVREDAAVALGVKGQALAAPALIAALQDQDLWVAVVAAVSLGMTQDNKAVKPLTELLQHEDWRMRGAALTGLSRSYLKDAVPPLISGLDDVDATVRKTAHQHLIALAKQQIDPEVEAWTAWWDQVKRSYQLFDPQELERRSKMYGYAGLADQDTATLFKNQDVVVFESRGDHMEHVLEALHIQHQKTAYGKLNEAELHPRAVYIVNCTGEIDAKDIDRIGWFVRTGGYLLGSCWALHETIERVYPGVVRKFNAPGEVMDTVMASPCQHQGSFLLGVFPDGVQPIYSLIGAHLIDVMDPERCEVLVDSAQCADRWGEGNLAVWFPAGHGVILDSVNHFEEQGLGNAPWLKKPEQRQAFAMDHMGMSYEEWRVSHKEKYWSKGGQAAREVLDLSVFRLISNFVRKKRISGE